MISQNPELHSIATFFPSHANAWQQLCGLGQGKIVLRFLTWTSAPLLSFLLHKMVHFLLWHWLLIGCKLCDAKMSNVAVIPTDTGIGNRPNHDINFKVWFDPLGEEHMHKIYYEKPARFKNNKNCSHMFLDFEFLQFNIKMVLVSFFVLYNLPLSADQLILPLIHTHTVKCFFCWGRHNQTKPAQSTTNLKQLNLATRPRY